MTREGAINRATNALERLNVDYGIGLEGGVVFIRDQLYVCNWGALLTNSGELFTASGASIPLPESFTQHLLRGEQLVNLVRNYMNGENARAHEGAVGLFTNQLVI